MLILIAKFKTKPQYREEFINIAEGMLEPSRSEEGCIHYELLQDPFNPDQFTFYEKWRSQEDLDEHNRKHYLIEFLNNIAGIIQEDGDVRTYEYEKENIIN